MRFELHCHTVVSHDGFTSLSGLLLECCRKGIGAVAVTEHDAFGLTDEAMAIARHQGIFLIPAVEATTDKGVHLIGLFVRDVPKHAPLTAIVAAIQEQAGFLSIPHPFKPNSGLLGNPASSEEEIAHALESAHFIELMNGGFDLTPFHQEILRLAERHGIACVAASDCHKQWQVGMLLTEIAVGEPSDLSGLRDRMASGETRLLRFEGFRPSRKKRNLGRRIRHSDVYQALIARVPYSLKRAIRLVKYRLELSKYRPSPTTLYEVIL